MSYEVSIVADSISPVGQRITTFQLRYPRMIHAELMTHRIFSRNASSTRAIPTAKMIEWIEKDPAMPVYWGKNQKGMQATEELSDSQRESAIERWLMARDSAIIHAKALMEAGVHKQISSRILEPWAHINVVLTGTSFENFFALRCHEAAMPEMQVLAVMMARAYRAHKPKELWPGMWHLPYVSEEEVKRLNRSRDSYTWAFSYDNMIRLLSCSVARCARVSYLTTDARTADLNEDIALHDRLEKNGHWSPFEHQASPLVDGSECGNFVGWRQYRKSLLKSVHRRFDYSTLDTKFEGRDFIV